MIFWRKILFNYLTHLNPTSINLKIKNKKITKNSNNLITNSIKLIKI